MGKTVTNEVAVSENVREGGKRTILTIWAIEMERERFTEWGKISDRGLSSTNSREASTGRARGWGEVTAHGGTS